MPSDIYPSSSRGSGHGFLFGCLGLVLFVIVAIAGLVAYGNWYMNEGYRNDPQLQSALAMVRVSPVAQGVLGMPITVEGVESESFSTASGKGKTVSYTVRLKGSRAEGSVHVMLHSDRGGMKIVSVILTGPDDERYTITQQPGSSQNSI